MRLPLSIKGIVLHGSHRGKLLGFPTANLVLNTAIPEGIYAAKVVIDEKEYTAATFIGAAKTFGQKDKKVESYIFNFDKDIYGKEIAIILHKKIRKNIAFASEHDLVSRIEQDVKEIIEYFNQQNHE